VVEHESNAVTSTERIDDVVPITELRAGESGKVVASSAMRRNSSKSQPRNCAGTSVTGKRSHWAMRSTSDANVAEGASGDDILNTNCLEEKNRHKKGHKSENRAQRKCDKYTTRE
jgi:hypothetical protein